MGADTAGWGDVRPGGRTARTRAAVFAAALQELAEQGFDRFSAEAVADRAGVHKTTVYRRWGTKGNLVAAALEDVLDPTFRLLPDTADLDGSMRAVARDFVAAMAGRAGIATVRALVSGGHASAEIRALVDRFFAARIARIDPVVQAAVGRGDLPPGTDTALLAKHVAGPLYYRALVMADTLTEADADLAAASALAGARLGLFAPRPEPA
ncbi:TetR/AcrR family transcriptional regulator [Kitasatospora sp. NPDC085464]|uniref:TetR/AcrR family transcriptional regulator n=1 Tax=Kitasatospora sp. NPDC085464 TaxID=3364063 RepID=UPI0037C97DBD